MTTSEGFHLNYVKEGQGEACIMLHGNPTWSFMYRNLIPAVVSSGFSAIAPDLIGCGLSDKPQKWNYCLEGHIRHFEQLVEQELRLDSFHLILHDWGGGVGMGYAVRHPEKIKSIIMMNTSAFPSTDVPKRIYLCRCPLIGSLLVRGCNALVETAVRRGPAKKMPPEVEEGYRFPYRNWHDRVGVLSFPNDIPLSPKHQTWKVLSEIERKNHLLKDKPMTLIWGEKDFCFHTGFRDRLLKIFPNAASYSFPDASHYLLEDAGEKIIPIILRHLQNAI